MTELRERDAMACRACGKEERASEGYPCSDCGRFICNMCSMRGVMQCADCARRPAPAPDGAAASASPGAHPGAPPSAPGKTPLAGA